MAFLIKLLNMFRIPFLLIFLFFLAVAGYTQPNGERSAKPVKIGLLIPDKKSLAAKNGAELAVAEANKRGGINGRPVELAIRSMEGPWGTGAKETVNLIFNDEVCAILASIDGRNAHLVEQVATKSRVVLLSAWTGDPTLSQAFVPWFYSCVPNNDRQASVLVEEIFQKQGFSTVGLISDQEYDSQSALKSFLKRANILRNAGFKEFKIQDANQDLSTLTDQLDEARLKAVVLFVKPSTAVKILEQFRRKKTKLPLFSTGMILNENEVSYPDLETMANLVRTTGITSEKSKQVSFAGSFQKQYGIKPGPVATFAYDGINLLIESIKKGGLEREKIQKVMSEIQYDGISGSIRFDEKGNLSGPLTILP
jgi:branched-chain amino acid transport system substrate-binding protein